MRTQEVLYREIDLELSWSEQELPERERTKHVHRLHPYLGKFVPQLAEAFLRRYAKEGDLVWDPFAGSGTTLMAAEATGRTAALVELDPGYCDVILRRWQEQTGGVATLADTDKAFDQVEAERAGEPSQA